MSEQYQAFFHFADDSTELRTRVAANLGGLAGDVRAAASMIGGTSVPFNMGDQIVRQVSSAQVQMKRAMAEMLDPTKLGGAPSSDQMKHAAIQSVTGAFQQARLEVDRTLRQLDPGSMERLVESGRIPLLMGAIGENLIKDTRRVYNEMWRDLPAHIQSQLPSQLPGGVIPEMRKQLGMYREDPNNKFRPLSKGLIGQEALGLGGAWADRVNRLYDIERDEEGIVVSKDRNDVRWVEAEQRALAERVRTSTNKTIHELREDQRRLSQALAQLVGQGDPYFKAMGVTLNPDTGMPVRRTSFGATDLTNEWQIAQIMSERDDLMRRHQFTQQMLASGQVRPIMGKTGPSQYLVDETGPSPSFYNWETKNGFELLRYLDVAEGKTRTLGRAQKAYTDEFNALQAAAAQGSAASTNKAMNQQPQGVVNGFLHGLFGRGFNGTGDLTRELAATNLATTAGSAMRYSMAYGGFYALSRAMSEGLAIFMDYQDSFTDFEVALGQGGEATQSFTNELMELSRVMGENVGAAYDAAARGVRAFAADATDAEKSLAGAATAAGAMKIGVIANKSLSDATGDMIAIGSAYGLSATEAEMLVPDALANAKREIGGDPAQIAQGLSNFAIAGNELGFKIQESANIIALIQSRTDQSGQAVATRLARIGQILSGSTGKSLVEDVNRSLGEGTIDPNGTPADQLKQLLKAYTAADKRGLTGTMDLIRSQLGGTANMRELTPLLQEDGQKALERALKNAKPGAGTDEFERKIENLIGTMNKLKGSIQNIVVLMAQADLFAPFAIAVKVLEPTLHVLERILKVYEAIEGFAFQDMGPVGAVTTTGIEVGLGVMAFQKLKKSALAANLAATSGVTGAVLKTAGVAPAAAGAAANTANTAATTANTAAKAANTGATASNAAATNAATAATGRMAAAANAASGALTRASAASTAMFGGGAAGAGAGKFKTFAKIGGALALLMAADQMAREDDQMAGYERKRLNMLANMRPEDADRLGNTSSSLKSLGANVEEEMGWWANLYKLGSGSSPHAITERANRDAKAVQYISEQVRAEQSKNDALRRSTYATEVFGDAAARTADSLNEAMKRLDEGGMAAQSRLRLLFEALMTPAAESPGSYEMPEQTAAKVVRDMAKGVDKALAAQKKSGDLNSAGAAGEWLDDTLWGAIPNADMGDVVRDVKIDWRAIQQKIAAQIEAEGQDLDENSLTRIAADAFDQYVDSGRAGNWWNLDEDKFREDVIGHIRKNVEVLAHQASFLRPLSPAELDSLVAAGRASIEEADPSDPTDAIRRAREYYSMLRTRIKATGTPAEAAADAMAEYRRNKDVAEGTTLVHPWFGKFGGLTADLEQTVGRVAFKQRMQVLEQAGIEKRDAEHQLRSLLMADFEDLRAAAEARNENKGKLFQRAERFRLAKDSFRAAGGDVALLEQLFEALDRQTVKQLIDYRKTQVRLAREALQRTIALIKQARQIFSDSMQSKLFGDSYAGEGVPTDLEDDPAYKKRKARLDRALERAKAADRAYERSTITEDKFAEDESEKETDDHTAWQHRALRAQALIDPDNTVAAAAAAVELARANLAAADTFDERTDALRELEASQDAYDKALATHAAFASQVKAARTNSPIDAAKAQIDGAVKQMRASAKGSDGYLQALISFYQGQWQMREAVQAYKNNLALLQGDMTDPVEQARDALKAAARKLAEDRANGAGKDVIAQDKVDKRQSAYALEKAKWDQKLSDMKIAEQLGRISHAQYIAYLERESRRMHRMNNKTRQQIDYMNQIDLELKQAADSMDAMWNLGDINTRGLVYQMRRYREEVKNERKAASSANAVRHGAAAASQTVTINIDGADVAKVRRIVEDVVGKPTRVITSSPRRR